MNRYQDAAGIRRFLRFGAIAALLGGAFFVLGILPHPIVYPKGVSFAEASQTPLWLWHQVFHIIGIALVLLALPALHLAQASRVGRFGLGAYAALLVSLAWLATFTVGITMIAFMPGADLASLDKGPPPGLFPKIMALCFPATFLSAVAFAVASWRAKVFPRVALVLLALSAPLEMVAFGGGVLSYAGGIAMGVAFTWMGVRLWTLSRGTVPLGGPDVMRSGRPEGGA